MKKNLLLSVSFFLSAGYAMCQGCIVVRGISDFGQYNPVDRSYSTSDWLININNRYFSSYRNFIGTKNQNTPPQDESVNHVYTMDFVVTRMLAKGWSLSFSLPFSANSRTSSLEHGGAGTTRHTTHSWGAGDIGLTAYKWILKPAMNQKWNIQLGLGIKFPSGAFAYEDYFYRNDTTRILAPVNASIQLGDGGTGIITELNTFYFFSNKFSAYGNFYYLISPRDQNGVSPLFGRTPTALQIRTGGNVISVTDIYSLRAGFDYIMKQFVFSAGLRDEGIPVYDLVGGSEGIRRPGNNVSIEPGITYVMKTMSVYLYVPVFIEHNILQSVPDKEVTKITGKYTTSYGGSGNYMIFLGCMFNL
jgi:hypothetical protein